MTRIKDISRAGWLMTGVVVALLLVPTGVAAKAFKATGIIGTSGNKAEVTAANQLLTTEASSGNLVQSVPVAYSPNVYGLGGPGSPIVTAPTDANLVVDVLHINVDVVPSQGLRILIGPSDCTSAIRNLAFDTPGTVGETDIELTPGAPVPAGDSLCLESSAQTGALEIWVSGYKDAPS